MTSEPAPSEAQPRCINLPILPTGFIGRGRELAQVCKLLSATRLLTLTGPGGGGKTRLALRAAIELAPHFRDGVGWTDLTSLFDPAYVTQTALHQLSLAEQAGQSAQDSLVDALGSQHMLIVLDNCEHLLAACASLAAMLLETCREVKILATSLQPLGLPHEQVWSVPPLAVPDAGASSNVTALQDYDSVRLFVARAREVLPAFELTPNNAATVAAICQRLDGLPLAIELAAARVKMLSVTQIADRLNEAIHLLTRGPAQLLRHQTLRATLEWSYRLLTEPEQTLLRRLSVFAGSFDLEMAEAIDGDDSEALSVLDRLASLADKSFVACLTADARGDMRYRLLETIRQYAREQLEAAGEGAVYADRHLDWYVALVEKAAPELRGASLAAWLDIFEREHDDLRTALQWACNQRRIEAGLRLAGSLERFWWVHGHLSEGRKWLFSLLAQSEPGPEPRAKVIWARALFAAGVLAYRQSDYTQAEDCFESSLQLRREIGDQVGIAFCLNNLGNVALDRGDYAHATALYMQALELRRASKDDWGIASSLNNLGNAAADQGEYARATQLYEQSLALYRQLDDRWSIASTLNNLGEVTQRLGEWRRAERLLRENLALRRELGDERGIALALGNLASLAIAQADWQPAGDLLKESLSRFKRVVDKADVASSFESLALVLNAQAQPGRAARLFGAAEVVRETIHAPLKPNELDDYEAEVEKVRAQLGEPAFTTAWTEGRAMSFDAAVAEALSSPIASPQPAVSVEPVAAPGLRIFALGPTRVTVGDHTLATTDWTYHKARELLFYLVSQPPATKAQIGLDLWPDASEHKLRSLFHRTLHYLRQALGRPDWVVFADGAYTFNRELNCWCDLQVFETLLEEAQAIGWAESKSPTDRAQAIQYLKNATALWRGDFIEDLDAGEWSIYRREELRRSYIGALIDLAQLYFDEAHYHAATDVYQRILSLDNYLEFAHRELMRCYARQGESSWAVRHYQQLRELLRQELQAEPSPETVLLYERIRRGDEV